MMGQPSNRAVGGSMSTSQGTYYMLCHQLRFHTCPLVLSLCRVFLPQLYPGDIVRWRCSYDTSDVPQGSSLAGGYSSAAGSLQEQCTVVLHYWPRVESMRGCSAATLTDKLLGENMCSSEAEDILQITGQEAQQFPMRWVAVWQFAQSTF